MNEKDTSGTSIPLYAPTSSDPFIKLIRIAGTQRFYRENTEPYEPISTSQTISKNKMPQTSHLITQQCVINDDTQCNPYEEDDEDCNEEEEEMNVATHYDHNVNRPTEKTTNEHIDGEQETDKKEDKTTFTLPPPHQPTFSGNASVRTFTFDQVVTASNTFGVRSDNEQLHTTSKWRKPYTHFISIPIGKVMSAHRSALEFLSSLCVYTIGEAGALSSTTTHLTPELVERVERLHITLLLLRLPEPGDVQLARQLLHESFENAWRIAKVELINKYKSNNLHTHFKPAMFANNVHEANTYEGWTPAILLSGINVMPNRETGRADVKHARVVYMSLHDEMSRTILRVLQDTLHENLKELIDDFDESMQSKNLPHMTVMNEKWRKAEVKHGSFDATGILAKFQDAAVGALKGEAGDINHSNSNNSSKVSSFFSKSTTSKGFFAANELEPFAFDVMELCRRGEEDPRTHTYAVEDEVKL